MASYSDGTLTTLNQQGKKRVSMPLAQEGSDAEMTERDYVILSSSFTPTLPAYATTDPDNALAYLSAESNPGDAGAGLIEVTRTFQEIPGVTTVYTTTEVSKPTFAEAGGYHYDNIYFQVTGAGTGTQLSSGLETYSDALSINAEGFIGWNQITRGAQTTSGSNAVCEYTAHGLAGTERLIIKTNIGYPYIFETGDYAVTNANYLSLTGWSATTWADLYSTTRTYNAGTATVRSRVVTTSYLPGVSVGITTGADIPIPSTVTSPSALLDAIIAGGTGFTNYSAQSLTVWMGEIYRQAVTQVDFDDL